MLHDTSTLFMVAGLLMVIGMCGGFLSGLLGVGGGIIFVPAIFFCLSTLGVGGEHAMHLAVASSLAVIAVTVFTSAREHHKRGSVDLSIVRSWGPFLMLGVLAGAVFAGQVEGRVLQITFAAVTGMVALYMFFGREKESGRGARYLTVPVQRFLSVIIGIAAAMTGMGGAVLTVPMMSGAGLPMQRATGTGAAMGLLVAIPGMVGYVVSGWPHMADLPPFSLGYVNVAIAVFILPMSILMAPVGVRVAHRTDRKVLRRLFAAVMMAVCLKMVFSI